MSNYFSKNFNYLLSFNYYSITELASILNVSRGTVYFYKSGEIMPNIENLIKISDLFLLDIKTLTTIDLSLARYIPNIAKISK